MSIRPPHNNHASDELIELRQRLSKLEEKAAKLANENSYLLDLYNKSPLPYQSLDENGCFLEVNEAWLNNLGYRRQEVLGRNFSEFLHPDWQEHFQENFPRFKAVGEVIGVEFDMRRKDGSFISVSFNGKIGKDAQDRFQQTYCVFQDITAYKQDETERYKLQEQLLQAQKMESVGRLAGGVAHDFNNMLSVILGHTEMIQEKLSPAEPFYAQLEEIHKAAKRSAELTRQLLAFARKQVISPTVLNLNDAVSGMLKMVQRLIGEDIDLVWQLDVGLWPVKMDPSQLDQILANLCVNSRDAIPDVGKITIGTGNTMFDAAYCADHPGYWMGEYVMLAVSDNGCGMNEKVKSHLYEPYFTTKESGKGTGLGLATVYGIVKQNQGFINVYSEPGRGTTFKIYLPRHKTKEIIQQTGMPAVITGGHETILVVEDEALILTMTTAMLEKLGYRVLPAGTPTGAIRLANGFDGVISLLLTDVVLPEMNGRELAGRMKFLFPNLKVLFMSGYTAAVTVQHGVLEKTVDFIEKPFAKKELADKIRSILDRNQQ